jgi:hypothetical protein
MDELGTLLADLADEAAARARAPGAAAARRRGRRRRLELAGGSALLVAALLAALVGLDRWAGQPRSTGAVTETEPPVAWRPFRPPPSPFRPAGPVVMVEEGRTNGDRWRLYAYEATRRGRDGRYVCLATHTPRGGGAGTCQPATSPVTVGATGLGAPARLVAGHVSRRADTVRLELAVPGTAPERLDLRPVPGSSSLPVDLYVAAVPRTRAIVRVIALDAAGRELGDQEGFPADDRLPPAGAATPLGEVRSDQGPLEVSVYGAEDGFTCLRVAGPSGGLEDGFLHCEPPPPADRPAVEADGICLGGRPDVGLLAGSAPRTAARIRVEPAEGRAVEAPAFDAGVRFGRAYWAVQAPDGAAGMQVLALDAAGAVVARATVRHTQPICGPP